MKIWRYLPDALFDDCLYFARFVKSEVDFNELMAVVNAVFATLWPVVRPLAVTLAMAARSPREFPCIERDIPVPISDWHLLEMDVPAHVTITKWAELKWANPSHYSEKEVPELTLPALADWLARANAQQLPEGYIPVLYTLEMHYARARLLEYQEPYAQLAWGSETRAIPVEKQEDGLWVSGPMREARIKPPIEITLTNDDGRLDLYIPVYWSPWIAAGFAEAELLRTCLHKLEKQGWEGGKRATDWLRRT